jgi:hypothetical protein
MATTLAPTIGSTALMRAARIEAHGADRAVSAREDVGTLPGCRLPRVTEHTQPPEFRQRIIELRKNLLRPQ